MPATASGSTKLDRDRYIANERDLVVVVLSFLAEGAGGERHVASATVIEPFASRFDSRITLGGTPVRAALALHALGIPSLLHLVAVNDDFRRLLPPSCACITSTHEASRYPHLIVQFPAGACVRIGETAACAPRPNRLIFTHDPLAEELPISDEIGPALAGARVFLISSLNAVREAKVLKARLTRLRQHMERLPSDAFVYYEDAGFHVPALSRHATEGLRGAVDVHGMNEEELQTHLGRSVNLLDVGDMAAALAELRPLVAGPILVVHTRHWALAFGSDPGRYETALRSGIAVATSRYLHGDALKAVDCDNSHRWTADPASAAFAAQLRNRLGDRVCCIPGVRSTEHAQPTTVGLGDAFVGGFLAPLVEARGTETVESRRRGSSTERRR